MNLKRRDRVGADLETSNDIGLFVMQCLIYWTARWNIYLYLRVSLNISNALTKLTVFITCLLATVLLSEIYYPTIDLPSQWLACKTCEWLLL